MTSVSGQRILWGNIVEISGYGSNLLVAGLWDAFAATTSISISVASRWHQCRYIRLIESGDERTQRQVSR